MERWVSLKKDVEIGFTRNKITIITSFVRIGGRMLHLPAGRWMFDHRI